MVVTAPSSDLVLQEAKTLTLHTNIQLWASLASEYLQLQLKPYVNGTLQILSDNINTITMIQSATEYFPLIVTGNFLYSASYGCHFKNTSKLRTLKHSNKHFVILGVEILSCHS